MTGQQPVSRPLKDVARVNPPADALPATTQVSFVPMAAAEANSGRLSTSSVRPYGDYHRGFRPFRESDVLFAKITPSMENGKVALAQELVGGLGLGSTEFHIVRAGPTLLPRYLLHYLLNPTFREEARHHMKGTAGQLRLPAKFLEQSLIAVPSIDDQAASVEELERQLARLEVAAEALRRVDQRVGRFVDQTYRAIARPADWPLKRLDDVAEMRAGIQKQPSRKPTKNRHPFLRVANVLYGRLDLREVHEIELFDGELDRLRLETGDLLVVEGNGSPGEIGRMALWDGSISNCVHQNHIIRARLRRDVRPEWVLAFWNSRLGREQISRVASSTSGLYTLSVRKVGGLMVPVPPPEIQDRLLAEFKRQMAAIGAVREALATAARRSVGLRTQLYAATYGANSIGATAR